MNLAFITFRLFYGFTIVVAVVSGLVAAVVVIVRRGWGLELIFFIVSSGLALIFILLLAFFY